MKEFNIHHKVLVEREDLQSNQAVSKKYLILDAALWDVEIGPAFGFGNKYCCLFATRGAEDELNDVAPYLFDYEDNDDLSKWVKYKETKDKRTLYLASRLSLEQVRKHLRRFLRVKTEDGKWLFFRFYDPEVAITTFQYLTVEQQNYFFSNVEYIQYDDAILKKRHNYFVTNKTEENVVLESKFPVMILKNGQLESMGVASFKRRAMLNLLNTAQTNRNIEELMIFVSDKTDQAMEYGIKQEGIVYDYILLNLKYEMKISRFSMWNTVHELLSNKVLTQFEKLATFKNLLISN